MLNKRQLFSIKHLEEFQGITKTEDIISWANGCLKKPKKSTTAIANKIPWRKHTRQYYQDIINHFVSEINSERGLADHAIRNGKS